MFRSEPNCVLIILIYAALLAGCVSLPRASGSIAGKGSQAECLWKEEGVENPFPKTRPTNSSAPLLFTIRFTDDGEFVQRCELTNALLELASPMPRLTVVYMHGWKHNADTSDEDLRAFQVWLSELQEKEKKSGFEFRRRVIGIYIAWNGKTMPPGINNVTFWGRKKAADLIAHSGAVTMVISKIHNIDMHRRMDKLASTDLTVYIGHSFGARILFSAVSDVMINQVEDQYPGEPETDSLTGQPLQDKRVYGNILGMGDLVVLLNPAFEASFYGPFQSLTGRYSNGIGGASTPRETFAPSQNPVIITLAAENDRATQFFFPLGQIVSTDWAKIRRTTLGNYGPAATHVVTDTNNARDSEHLYKCASAGSWWYDDFCDTQGVCLKRISNGRTTPAETGDPFIVARVPKSVINGHSGIWRGRVDGFLLDFVTRTTQSRTCFPKKAD